MMMMRNNHHSSFSIAILFLLLHSNYCHENATNTFVLSDEYYLYACLVAAFFVLIIAYSIVCNVLMLIILCFYGRNVYNHSFNLITLQMIIANIVHLTPQMTIVVPGIINANSSSSMCAFLHQ